MFSKFTNFAKFSKFNKFSSKNFNRMLRETTSSQALGYALAGIGIGGLAFLMWNLNRGHTEHVRSMLAIGQRVPEDVALQRTKDTMQYFTGGLFATSLITALMLRSPRLIQYSSNLTSLLIAIPANFFFIYKIHSTPYTKENTTIKHFYYGGFIAATSFTLLPLIYASELIAIRDAFILTSGVMGGMGLVAMNSKDDAFLSMGGILGAGLGGLVAIGLANLFLKSHALYQVSVFGGLALFTALTLYDMKLIQAKARVSPYFDPMSQSLSVYLDFINIFVRLLAILNDRKRK
jgi:FtsH-binding integral membrane protein